MVDSPFNSPERPPPRRFQFGFWTLAEIVTGAGVAAELVAELLGAGWLIVLLAAGILCSAWYIGVAAKRKTAVGRVGIAWILALAALCFWPLYSDGRSPSRRSNCVNNMRQIVLALQQYHDHWGQFPPAVVRGPDGVPMHSWRTLILPYTEYRGVYAAYDFTQPWKGPANAAIAQLTSIQSCPASPHQRSNLTNYFYVVGRGREAVERGLKLGELESADGAANTILLVESSTISVNWFEPRDMTMDEALAGVNATSAPCISSRHGLDSVNRHHGANIAMADLQIHYVSNGVDDQTLRALLTVDGGEKIDWSKLEVIPDRSFVVHWLISCTIAYVAFIIWRHWPRRQHVPVTT